MRYTSLKLKNFTVFKDASFDFSPGVNVFVGANGTGKTHALKALYALQRIVYEGSTDYPAAFAPIFQIARFDDLVSASARGNHGSAMAETDLGDWGFTMRGRGAAYWIPENPPNGVPRPVFIPSVDMLAHTKAFLSTWDLYRIDFDLTYRDIVLLLLAPEKRDTTNLSIDLASISGGLALDIDEKEERFYITMPAGRFAAPLVSEGVRKLATLVRLVRNDSIRPGTTLFGMSRKLASIRASCKSL